MNIQPGIPSPAKQTMLNHGDVLRSLGASDVRVVGDSIELTFTDNKRAVNVDAMLKDVVEGTRLVVKNQSTTADAHSPSAYGIAEALAGVEGLTVETQVPRCPCDSFVSVIADNPTTLHQATELLEPKPAPLVNVSVIPATLVDRAPA